jgi:hypothetical protein
MRKLSHQANLNQRIGKKPNHGPKNIASSSASPRF